MTIPFGRTSVQALLLDIEGTTTPVDFVYQVLFPYSRNHVKEFIRQHPAEVRADIEKLREEHARDRLQELNPPRWQDESADSQVESIVAYVQWLIDRDRKSPALKSLQGKIWEVGYRTGELRSQVYPDVPPAFERWHSQKKDICIFSSGSVLAQKLLFANTTAGDLTRFIRDYFDTTVGPKAEAESYRRIAMALEVPSSQIAFLSDVTAELDAAQLAGVQTALCVRPGRPQPDTTKHPVIHTFDQIFP